MHLPIDLAYILRTHKVRIGLTWSLVLLENLLMALVPLLIGLSIDGLLSGNLSELMWTVVVLVSLVVIGVGRRVFDTRAYGTIRLHLGDKLQSRTQALSVSKRTARIDMSRELVDFLEHDAPSIITAFIQLGISLAILFYFDLFLGLSSIVVLLAMVLFYSCFHLSFYDFNRRLNEQVERQVDVLTRGSRLDVFRHLRALRQHEVSISDTEALVYGGIFLFQIGFIAFNLYQGAQIAQVTAGQIFSIASYSWEYVEAALMLPIALQGWSRLSEVTRRINQTGH